MDKVGYTSVTTCAGHAKLFHPRNIHLGHTTDRAEWQPLILLCISLPPDLSQNGFIGTKADRVLIAGGISPFQSDHLQPRPKTALYVLSNVTWDLNTLPTIAAYLARHGCYSHQ